MIAHHSLSWGLHAIGLLVIRLGLIAIAGAIGTLLVFMLSASRRRRPGRPPR